MARRYAGQKPSFRQFRFDADIHQIRGDIGAQGFEFGAQNVSYPYLWWSRASDFGLLERWGLRQPPPVGQREETLVNCVARKPLASAPT